MKHNFTAIWALPCVDIRQNRMPSLKVITTFENAQRINQITFYKIASHFMKTAGSFNILLNILPIPQYVDDSITCRIAKIYLIKCPL